MTNEIQKLVKSMVRKLLLFYLFTFLPFSPAGAQTVPMDYSYCGYHRSEQPIPSVKSITYVTPSGQDDATTIQAAIDWVSQQKPDKQTGFRGAVLLGEGTFTINTPLRIRTSGVVLRGSGCGKTTVYKTGYDRGAAIYIEGTHNIVTKDTFDISDVKVGSLSCHVKGGSTALKPGTRITICRPSTQEWIDYLNCASFG